MRIRTALGSLAKRVLSRLHAFLPGRQFYWGARRILQLLPAAVALPLAQSILVQSTEGQRRRYLSTGYLGGQARIKLRLHPYCDHSALFSLLGYYESDLTRVVRERCSGGTMVDLGANYGYYSVLWLSCSSRSRVVAIEPCSDNLVLLRENLAPFGKRADIAATCVSDKEGTVTMHVIDRPGMLCQVLDPRNRRNPDSPSAAGQFSASSSRLESIFRSYLEKEACEFLKVDIEGMDALVLLDSADLFASRRIRCVAWEGTGTARDKEVETHLLRHGYRQVGCKDALCYALD